MNTLLRLSWRHRHMMAVLGTCALVVVACTHEPMLAPAGEEVFNPSWEDPGAWISPINTVPCNPGTVYFQNQVYPILFTYCTTSGCHNTPTEDNKWVVLTTRDGIMDQVDAGDPGNSDLWEEGLNATEEPMPPSDHPQLTGAQEQLIYDWIAQGALDNACNTCDTLSASYGTYATVSSIFQSKCNGCHSGTVLNGNLDLSQYDNAHAIAVNQTLWRVLAHAPGYPAMPPYPDGRFLSACDMYQIRKWIANGAPN